MDDFFKGDNTNMTHFFDTMKHKFSIIENEPEYEAPLKDY